MIAEGASSTDFVRGAVKYHYYVMANRAGRRLRVQVDGKVIQCATIGELAQALHRSVFTIRKWERTGLLPNAPLELPSDKPQAVRRLYPLELIDAVRQVTVRENFGTRRPSGRFREQSAGLYEAWRTVMVTFFDDDGFTDPTPE
jgi:hypothetical protein